MDDARRMASKETADLAKTSDPLIGALLRMPWETIRRRMLAGLHAEGFDDLDAAHLTVFQYPGPDYTRPSELAARLRVSKQALNKLLAHLERLQYLERHPDPEDQRFKRIIVTKRGQAAIAAIRRILAQVEHDWEQQLGSERLTQFRGVLIELNQLDAGQAQSPLGREPRR